MRVLALFGVLLLTACGTSAATAAPTPSPTPSPTPDVPALYLAAINTLHDSALTDGTAFFASKPDSPEEAAAASKLAADFETLLSSLDKIPFPTSAAADVSAFKKAVVARQVFWSEVGINGANYSAITDNSTTDAYNQTGILLGHDIGVTLVLTKPTPTP